jgi:hypothetical protein
MGLGNPGGETVYPTDRRQGIVLIGLEFGGFAKPSVRMSRTSVELWSLFQSSLTFSAKVSRFQICWGWLFAASETGQNPTSWAHRNCSTVYHGHLITFPNYTRSI